MGDFRHALAAVVCPTLVAVTAATHTHAFAAEQAPSPHADVRAKLEQQFPNATISSLVPGPADGIYEVVSGANLYYYLPGPNLLLFGEFYTAGGESLTMQRIEANRLSEVAAAAWHSPEALNVRPGQVRVTAYLDVDCGHCRQAVHWFLQDNALPQASLDVVFVSRTPAQAQRAAHVLCAPTHLRGAALQQAFGRVEGDWIGCEGSDQETQKHSRIAANLGVEATPMFAVGSQVVTGFDRERITQLVNRAQQPQG